MNNSRHEIFDPSLDVFKVHFENDPIVPGMLLLLRELQQRPRPPHSTTHVERLAFKSFVRPDQQVTYLNEGTETRINSDSNLCCSFSTRIGNRVSAPVFIDEPCLSTVPITPTREPLYWFLPEQINLNEDGSHAQTCIDLQQVITQHPYLEQIPDPALLVMTEALGNLALVLQQRRAGGCAASYVFARFDALDIDLDRGTAGLPLHLKTRIRHFGSFLAWDACAWDEQSVRLVVHNAISVKRKIA
ncbi:hypothetical protein EAH72_30830 [Pseudomonas caspiana]|nr:hypothetical protein [Pseudomonas caspiana]TPG90021.1 hypothetical protein EAH72_30830 [Pseudomonas caspiana]